MPEPQFPCVVQFALSNLQWHNPASSSRWQDVLVLHVYLETAHHASKPFKSNPEKLQSASLTACFSAASSDSKVTVCISSVDGTHLGVAWHKLMDLAKPRTVELRNQDGILMTVSLLSRRAVGVKPAPLTRALPPTDPLCKAFTGSLDDGDSSSSEDSDNSDESFVKREDRDPLDDLLADASGDVSRVSGPEKDDSTDLLFAMLEEQGQPEKKGSGAASTTVDGAAGAASSPAVSFTPPRRAPKVSRRRLFSGNEKKNVNLIDLVKSLLTSI